MNEKRTWNEFRENGLLWFINSILHVFGWCIVIEKEDGEITDVYPARTKFRGFSQETNDEGYRNVASYLNDNIELIKAEAFEEFEPPSDNEENSDEHDEDNSEEESEENSDESNEYSEDED